MPKASREPGPDHPITVEPTGARVVVTVAGEVVADSTEALTLREATYPPVQYIPRQDVRDTALRRAAHTTHCPYKGDASYFDLVALGSRGSNAVWSYEAPAPAVAAIKDHLAFYPDRATVTVEWS